MNITYFSHVNPLRSKSNNQNFIICFKIKTCFKQGFQTILRNNIVICIPISINRIENYHYNPVHPLTWFSLYCALCKNKLHGIMQQHFDFLIHYSGTIFPVVIEMSYLTGHLCQVELVGFNISVFVMCCGSSYLSLLMKHHQTFILAEFRTNSHELRRSEK